jgi:hypothetical protein
LSDRGAVVEARGRLERALLDAGLRGVAGAGVIVVDNIRVQNGCAVLRMLPASARFHLRWKVAGIARG